MPSAGHCRAETHPPGALAAAGSLSFPEQLLWRQPNRKSPATNDTDLVRGSRASRGSCECTSRALVPFAVRTAPSLTSRGPSGRGLLSFNSNHNRLGRQPYKKELITPTHSPHVEAVSAQARLSFR